jgi:anti-sigma B factor antagonist
MDLSITTRTEGDAYICTLDGAVDSVNADKLNGQAEAAAASGVQRLIFDLTKVEYVASAGLGKFVLAIKSFPGKVAFAGLQPYVRQTFMLSGFDRIAAICPTLEDALKG